MTLHCDIVIVTLMFDPPPPFGTVGLKLDRIPGCWWEALKKKVKSNIVTLLFDPPPFRNCWFEISENGIMHYRVSQYLELALKYSRVLEV